MCCTFYSFDTHKNVGVIDLKLSYNGLFKFHLNIHSCFIWPGVIKLKLQYTKVKFIMTG